jgi:microcystin-dependent protein
MSQPFVGQILTVAFNFAPQGWATCDGQLQAISQNIALFALLGTTYGGDGQTTFALPDLRGRSVLAMSQGPGLQNYVIGQAGGEEAHTLSTPEMPGHNHALFAAATGNVADPGPGVVLGVPPAIDKTYAAAGAAVPLAGNSIGQGGGNLGHENRQPYLTLNYIISLFGIFPSQA